MPCPDSVRVLQHVPLLPAELLPNAYVQMLLSFASPAERCGEYQGVRGLLWNCWLASWGYEVLLQRSCA
jgi:hypothetical protein